MAEAKPKSASRFWFCSSVLAFAAGLLAVVLVVQRDQFDLPALHAALGVEHRKVSLRAVADVLAELGVAAGQRRRLADDPFVLSLG